MAVTKTSGDSRLTMVVQTGQKPDNTPILQSKSYGRVRAAATDEEVFSAGMAIAGLQSMTLHAIERNDNATLSQ